MRFLGRLGILALLLAPISVSFVGCSSRLSEEEAKQQDTSDDEGDEVDDGGGAALP